VENKKVKIRIIDTDGISKWLMAMLRQVFKKPYLIMPPILTIIINYNHPTVICKLVFLLL